MYVVKLLYEQVHAILGTPEATSFPVTLSGDSPAALITVTQRTLKEYRKGS
jgi:hypothetical protein